jgi:hypothetical protein
MWEEMADDLAGEFEEQYLHVTGNRSRLALQAEVALSPDGNVRRYRTIEARIRRRRDRPTLLDLVVGNMFMFINERGHRVAHVVHDPRYAQWARQVSQIALKDHVRLTQQFVGDLQDAGWGLEEAKLFPVKINPPQIRHGAGICVLPAEKFLRLARRPAKWPDQRPDIAVVVAEGSRARLAVQQAQQALDNLFGQSRQWPAQVFASSTPLMDAVNLILLEDQLDLADQHELRDALRCHETAGIRFKLAKTDSLRKPFPAQNIAYDLFILAGGRPWLPVEPQPLMCSLDAGHDKDRRTSRWVRVETNAELEITGVRSIDTALAEHIPADIVRDLWPTQASAILCRDGRMSQERQAMEARAAAEARATLEVKKSPNAILWREADDGLAPALFGDAVIDNHGDILLQTVSQNVKDYVHPIRLTTTAEDAIGLATTFLHQQAMPQLSLFNRSRLPGALYFADLVSKRTGDGWPKAIGRGFHIPEIVP